MQINNLTTDNITLEMFKKGNSLSIKNKEYFIEEIEGNIFTLKNLLSGKVGKIDFNQLKELLILEIKNNTESSNNQIANIEEKVEESLREKQKNKYFKDVGERVSGSRKEMSAFTKLMTLDEFKKLDNAVAYKLAQKSKIIPEYNTQEDIDNGASGGAVFIKQKLYSAIASKSKDSDKDREDYFRILPIFWGEILSKKTLSDIKAIGYRRFLTSYRGNGDYLDNKAIEGEEFLISKSFGKRFLNLLCSKTTESVKVWDEAKKYEAISEEEINIYYDIYKSNLVKNKEAYLESIKQIDDNGLIELVKKDYKFFKQIPTDEQIKEGVEKLKNRRIEAIEKRFELKSKEQFMSENSLKTGEQDYSFLKEEPKNKKVTSLEDGKRILKIHNYTPIKEIIRVGGREVLNEEIKDNETLIKNFGYKAVEYGNWVKDNEAIFHVSNFIGAMKDLEDILGISIKDLNSFGKVGIAFGSRGKMGMVASYDPRAGMIALTKKLGDGSVAHEVGHFLDHVFAGQDTGGGLSYLSGRTTYRASNKYPEGDLFKLMKIFIDYISKGSTVIEKEFTPPEKTLTYYYPVYRTMFRNGESIESLISHAENNNGADEKVFNYISSIYKKSFTAKVKKAGTMFMAKAKSEGSYWVAPTEMFARAFEAYIYDTMKKNGKINNYLVAPNDLEYYSQTSYPEDAYFYPQGVERDNINEIISIIIQAIKSKINQQKKP